MAFKKGQSGNPGGRPKMPVDVQALLKSYTKEAIETLVQVMRDAKANPGARATAAMGILKKVVPDLASTEIKTESTSYVALLPEVCETAEEWMAKAQKPVEAPRTAEASDPIDTATKH